MFLKIVLWLILAGIAFLIAGPWGIVAVLVLTIVWMVVSGVLFAVKEAAGGFEGSGGLTRAAEQGEREREEAAARAQTFPTTPTIEQWTHRKDGDGNYWRCALHFPTMTYLEEFCWGAGPSQRRRGEFAARRLSSGDWQILPTWATFSTLLESEEDLGERAEMQKKGRVWGAMPQEMIGAVETAYQRYIHSGG